MNYLHRRLCRSERWKQTVEKYALPWTLEDINLGDNVLEVGPGPGVTTDLIRARVARLTCVEIDCAMADSLAQRTAGSNVTVVCEDATAMSLPSASFDSAVSFTMLHHVQRPPCRIGCCVKLRARAAWRRRLRWVRQCVQPVPERAPYIRHDGTRRSADVSVASRGGRLHRGPRRYESLRLPLPRNQTRLRASAARHRVAATRSPRFARVTLELRGQCGSKIVRRAAH